MTELLLVGFLIYSAIGGGIVLWRYEWLLDDIRWGEDYLTASWRDWLGFIACGPIAWWMFAMLGFPCMVIRGLVGLKRPKK